MSTLNQNQVLQNHRTRLQAEDRLRRNWAQNWGWVIEENRKVCEKVYDIIKENKEFLVPSEDKFYNSKISTNVFPKKPLKVRNIHGEEETWPPIPKTTNGIYGRLSHLTTDKYDPIAPRKVTITELTYDCKMLTSS